MWWQVAGLPVVVVPDVRRLPPFVGCATVVIVFTDQRRALIDIPGNKSWQRVVFKRSSAAAFKRLAEDAVAITQHTCEYRYLPDEVSVLGGVSGFSCWPWSEGSALAVLQAACQPKMLKRAVDKVSKAIAPSLAQMWQALLPAEAHVLTSTDVVVYAPKATPGLWWIITHARRHGIVLDRVIALGSVTIPREATRKVLYQLTVLKITAECDNLRKLHKELLPPDSAWFRRLDAAVTDGVADVQHKGPAGLLINWVKAQRISVSPVGITEARFKDRTKQFNQQLVQQARRLAWSYPHPPCYSEKRDSGATCLRCPISPMHSQRFLICGAGPTDTPASIYRNRFHQGAQAPPCVQQFTGHNNAARFDMAIICAHVFHSVESTPPTKKLKRPLATIA